MNWRRGLLLAGIHLAIAIPVCSIEESFMWNLLRSQSIPAKSSIELRVVLQEEQMIDFQPDPCDMWRTMPAPLEIVEAANLPALLFSGWGDRCPATTPMARLSEDVFGEKTRRADLFCMVTFCFLIVAQWVLVGGFPLVQFKRWWWLEPGVLITLCVPVGIAFAFLKVVGGFAHAFAWFALLGWVYLIGCGIVKAFRVGLKVVTRKPALIQGRNHAE